MDGIAWLRKMSFLLVIKNTNSCILDLIPGHAD